MSYTQLTREERYVIAHLKMFKLSLREIARRLGRHHSTISREIKRNGPAITRWVYWYDDAHPRALERRTRARHHRRRDNGALYEYVAQRLRARWSPECIAGRLALDYPAQPAMRVSPEAIYRWIVRDAKAGGQLYRCLCLAHKRRRRQRRYGSLRGLIPGRVSIAERPAVVDKRRRFGDWERGVNENTNGLLRRYYPKGTDFSQVADDELAFVVHALNNRPRKCLGYRTPFEVVQRALN